MSESFEITKFLEEYEQFPCLWKKCSPEFKIRSKRDHAEKILLESSGLASIKILRQKIRSIRCTYNQEKAKVKKSMGTGSATSDIYTPKLSWFHIADNFLSQNFQDEGFTQSNLDFSKDLENESQQSSNSEIEEVTHDFPTPLPVAKKLNLGIEEVTHEFPTTPTVAKKLTTPTVAKKLNLEIEEGTHDFPTTPTVAKKLKNRVPTAAAEKRKKKDSSIDNAVDYLKEVAGRTSQNEFATFGQHIGLQLQRLPLEEALILQGDIQQLVTAARLRCLTVQQTFVPNTAPLVVVTSNSSEVISAPSTSTSNSSGPLSDICPPLSYFTNWNCIDD